MFFSFFGNFDSVGQKWGKRAKMAQILNRACTHCIWGTTHAGMVIFNTLMKNYNMFSLFFHFLEILILLAKNGVKGKKWPKSCIKLVRTVSEELYMLLWWFLVHLWKIIISPGAFFIFWKFLFCGEKWPKIVKQLKLSPFDGQMTFERTKNVP